MKDVKRAVYIGLGTFFLALGAVGIAVPLLPTVPFWLLTCWFYLRSSPTLYARFLDSRYFGKYMRCYLEERYIPVRAKAVSLSVMWVSLVFTSFFTAFALWIKIVLVVIGLGVSMHLLSFPSRQKRESGRPDD